MDSRRTATRLVIVLQPRAVSKESKTVACTTELSQEKVKLLLCSLELSQKESQTVALQPRIVSRESTHQEATQRLRACGPLRSTNQEHLAARSRRVRAGPHQDGRHREGQRTDDERVDEAGQ